MERMLTRINRSIIIFIFLFLISCIWGKTVSYAASDNITEGDFVFTENSDGTLTALSYIGNATEISVPDVVDGKTVTHIGSGFIQYENVANSIKKITLPETITDLDEFAFSRCHSLTDINLPNGITAISDYVFYNNYSLEKLDLPDNLVSIGYYSFINCRSLKEFDIPSSLTDVWDNFTAGCESLECFKIAGDPNGSSDSFKCVDGVLFNAKGNKLVRYPAAKEGTAYVIPEGTEELGSQAFSDSYIIEVTLPSTMEDIEGAFEEAKHLEKYIVSPENKHYVSAMEDFDGYSLFAYGNNGNFTLVSHPAGSQVKDYVVADQVTSIAGGAFCNCIYLETITLGKVKKLGAGTFRYCNALKEVTIPETTNSIYFTAFMDCYNLEAINVSEGNEYYASDNGILYTKDFEELYIYPIANPVVSYTIKDGCTSIHRMAAEYNKYLEEIDLKGVRTINGSAFSKAERLSKITFDENLDSITIDYSAFSSCSALGRVYFPANIKTIGENAFGNCKKLQKLFFYGPCPEVDNYMFDGYYSGKKAKFYVFPQYLEDYKAFVKNYDDLRDVTVVEWNGEEIPDLEEYDMSGVTFSDRTFTYDGKYKSIEITGQLPDGVTVGYSGNKVKNVGVYSVLAYFNGDSSHEPIPNKTAYITIKKASNSLTGASKPVYGSNGKITWDIKAAFGTVKLTFSKTKDGKYTSTVPTAPREYFVKASVAGTDNYTGVSKIGKVTVLPKGTSVSKLTAASKAFTVKWKKPDSTALKNITGYQIQYSTSSSFKSGNKTVTVSKNNTLSKKIGSLKAKKKYYVRVRTYKTVSGKKICSDWSAAKSVTTKP